MGLQDVRRGKKTHERKKGIEGRAAREESMFVQAAEWPQRTSGPPPGHLVITGRVQGTVPRGHGGRISAPTPRQTDRAGQRSATGHC
ncbi:hypothetical protein NQZ68_016769 [Dissostichus eleginoides]|nr:hypothetical protein NQZ68_016769 [Dissostichus eleginoides]